PGRGRLAARAGPRRPGVLRPPPHRDVPALAAAAPGARRGGVELRAVPGRQGAALGTVRGEAAAGGGPGALGGVPGVLRRPRRADRGGGQRAGRARHGVRAVGGRPPRLRRRARLARAARPGRARGAADLLPGPQLHPAVDQARLPLRLEPHGPAAGPALRPARRRRTPAGVLAPHWRPLVRQPAHDPDGPGTRGDPAPGPRPPLGSGPPPPDDHGDGPQPLTAPPHGHTGTRGRALGRYRTAEPPVTFPSPARRTLYGCLSSATPATPA